MTQSALPPRPTAERPWWWGVLTRQAHEIGCYVDPPTRRLIGYAAILALVYVGANHGLL